MRQVKISRTLQPKLLEDKTTRREAEHAINSKLDFRYKMSIGDVATVDTENSCYYIYKLYTQNKLFIERYDL